MRVFESEWGRVQLRGAWPFTIVGVACVIAGGLVAAITSVSPTEQLAWSAAYLVLVAGVAQVGLGLGQQFLPTRPPSRRLVLGELALWNVGNAAVMYGTLAGAVAVVDVGGALLVLTLGLVGYASRGAARTWLLHGFRALIAILLVSIPVGLVLARIG